MTSGNLQYEAPASLHFVDDVLDFLMTELLGYAFGGVPDK